MTGIEHLIRPRTIAIIGASPRSDSAGGGVIRTLERVGFDGRLYPVNPHRDAVLGHRCYPSLADIPETPDAAFIGLGAVASVAALAEAGALGIDAAAIHAGGFADAGVDGARLQRELVQIATRYEIAVSGPNNMGVLNVLDRTGLWPMDFPLTPGPIAIISQSGSAAIALTVDPKRLGLSYVITAGNEAVIDVARYLEVVVSDPRVRVVMLFLESIRSPDRFAAAARIAADRGIRIVAIKVGRSDSGQDLVRSHTASIAGSDESYGAFLEQCGVLRVGDFDEMLELTALLVAHPSPPKNKHTVAVTTSGGEAALVADLAAQAGLELPRLPEPVSRRVGAVLGTFAPPGNPIDAWGTGWDGGRVRTALLQLAPTTTIAVVDAPSSGGADAHIAQELVPLLAELRDAVDGNVIILNTTGASGVDPTTVGLAAEHGVPVLSGLGAGLQAIAKWAAYRSPIAIPPRRRGRGRGRAHRGAAQLRAALDRGELTAAVGAEILSGAGIPMAPERVVDSAAEAIATADRLGYPVVLKGYGVGIMHKHALGLVTVGIENATALRTAFRLLRSRLEVAGAERPAITVQPQLGGLELFVGVRNDATFGPVVVVGLGGTEVEVTRAVSVHVGEVSARAARRLLLASPAGKRLARGGTGPDPDLGAAVGTIVELSRLASSLPDVVESIEINPLIVRDRGRGAIGVDLVVTSKAAAA